MTHPHTTQTRNTYTCGSPSEVAPFPVIGCDAFGIGCMSDCEKGGSQIEYGDTLCWLQLTGWLERRTKEYTMEAAAAP